MNKRLKRLMWPGLVAYFVIMAACVIAAVVMEQYILAGAEGAVTLLLVM